MPHTGGYSHFVCRVGDSGRGGGQYLPCGPINGGHQQAIYVCTNHDEIEILATYVTGVQPACRGNKKGQYSAHVHGIMV